MPILIDMEMPDNCIDCQLIAEEYTGAGVYECVWLQKKCLRNQRRKDCPLKEVDDRIQELEKKLHDVGASPFDAQIGRE